mgnify:CR=1 FL=1
MASPFAVFRKHQKWMIATLGLMAMIAFVFLPIIMKRMEGGSGQNRVVVATKKFGDLRDYDMWALVAQRQRVLQFAEDRVELLVLRRLVGHRQASHAKRPALTGSSLNTRRRHRGRFVTARPSHREGTPRRQWLRSSAYEASG